MKIYKGNAVMEHKGVRRTVPVKYCMGDFIPSMRVPKELYGLTLKTMTVTPTNQDNVLLFSWTTTNDNKNHQCKLVGG